MKFLSTSELASASTDSTLRLWDVKDNCPVCINTDGLALTFYVDLLLLTLRVFHEGVLDLPFLVGNPDCLVAFGKYFCCFFEYFFVRKKIYGWIMRRIVLIDGQRKSNGAALFLLR